MKALIIDKNAALKFENFNISDDWFGKYSIPENILGLKHVKIGDFVYLLSSDLDNDNAPVLVINLEGNFAVLSEDNFSNNTDVFSRILTVAQSIFTNNVKIPYRWKFYNQGNLCSVNALPSHKSFQARINYERNPSNSEDIYVFAFTNKTEKFDEIDKNSSLFEKAKLNLAEAILSDPDKDEDASDAGIVLSERLPQGFQPGQTLDAWYNTKLTGDQRAFVDLPYDNPARLRGAAGTGKTIALIVKFIKDGQSFEKSKRPKKLGFITHSSGSSDSISSIINHLDTTGLLYKNDSICKLELRTLYQIANEYLRYDQDGLEPLSVDGYEGKKLQAELIKSILKETYVDKIFKSRHSKVSPELLKKWRELCESDENLIVTEIMHEFSSVLDAEGIRSGNELSEKYVRGSVSRPKWLVTLDRIEDRRFMLALHKKYRENLIAMKTISVDQMIADFNSFLDSNRWDQIRKEKGYDALFIDELHFFTSLERQTLHKLIKPNVIDGVEKRPAIFMAYDLKQSPRDVFSQYVSSSSSLFNASNNLVNTKLVDLKQVFRYTPEIAELLRDIDAKFPAIDIPGEWGAYVGKTNLESGANPVLTEYENELEQFKSVFDSAVRLARANRTGGRRVAVLCVSEEAFAQYLTAASGQYGNKYFPILDRDPSSELKHLGKKFVFSMPEYVAGLQFETVFLINVDSNEAPIDSGPGLRRRFISNVYLGASRAEKSLFISSCLSRGGSSDVLDLSISRGSLIRAN